MRRWLILLGLPLLLWSAYWGVGAYALRHGLESTLQDQSHGAIVTRYEQIHLSGFPTEFKLNMSNLELRRAGMFSWKLPQLEAQAPSYLPQNIRLEVAGEQRIETALGSLKLTADLLEVGIFLRPSLSLPLARSQLHAEGALLSDDGDGGQFQAGRLLMELTALDSVEQNGTVLHPYQLGFEADDLDLSQSGLSLPPSHHNLDTLRGALTLAFSSGLDLSVLDQGLPRLVGVLIQGLAIQAGGSELQMIGQLAQAPTGLLSGNLVVDVVNWRELLAVFRDAGYVDPDIADLMVEFLGAQYPGEQMTLPLDIENGQIRLGVFTLGILPALP
jgi:hypothetical protein